MRYLTIDSCLGFDLQTSGLIVSWLEPFMFGLSFLGFIPKTWVDLCDCRFFHADQMGIFYFTKSQTDFAMFACISLLIGINGVSILIESNLHAALIFFFQINHFLETGELHSMQYNLFDDRMCGLVHPAYDLLGSRIIHRAINQSKS